MKKYVVNFLQSGNGIVIILVVIICLSTWFYMLYTSPKDILYKYNGIKYQTGNLQSAESVNIEIEGTYMKELFPKYVEFNGTIRIGEMIFTGISMRFDEYRMGSLDSNEGTYGMMFINDMFEKITIEIFEHRSNGGYSWSGENGWLISAPCDNRKEAVEISNLLIQKHFKGLVLK